jgi:hypothetical protein
MCTRRRPGRERAWPASGSAFINTQGDVELDNLHGLVHKLTGHRIIGSAPKLTAPHIFNKKSKIAIKRWAKVHQKITKNIETIFSVQTIVKNAQLLK